MPRYLLVSAILLLTPFMAAQSRSAQDNKSSDSQGTHGAGAAYQPVPVDEVRRANPVKATPESLAAGKKIFAMDCAVCHGADGRGKTEVSKQSKIPDLTVPGTLKGRTDGELSYRIKTGHGAMPGEGDRVKPEQLWDVVNYVRSLSDKKLTEEKAAQ